MCLAVPAKIKSIDGDMATVEISGVTYEASLMLTPQAKVGDYVILHAGFAIQILDQDEARQTLKLFDEIAKLTQKEVKK
ncbi:MAG: HypC/HybG/HupF family hydrogenase formation chaperone [candidate division WOR-3 bacterium]